VFGGEVTSLDGKLVGGEAVSWWRVGWLRWWRNSLVAR